MRILFITEQFPFPLDNGGNVRTFHILRGLAQEHEITLLAARCASLSEADRRVVGNLCREVRLVPRPRSTVNRDTASFACSLVSRLPFVLLRHSAAALHRELRTLFDGRARSFDAVHFNHLDSTLYDKSIPARAFRVLDQHNIVTNQLRTTLPAETRPLYRAILRYELPKVSAFEAKTCNTMNLCLVCSETDRAALQELGVKTRIVMVPNGADLEYFAPASRPVGGNRELVFVGSLDYDPCEKAVWYFCDEILPLLRKRITDIRFVVIGRNPSVRLRTRAAADHAIVLTGRVEDVRPHVQRAGVFVAPLLSGSGTRLKIIEAMAMGVPVVSTTIGAQGIAGTDGVHLRIADAPEAFASAVVGILGNPRVAERMRVAGRELVEQQYGWTTIHRTLLSAYAEADALPLHVAQGRQPREQAW